MDHTDPFSSAPTTVGNLATYYWRQTYVRNNYSVSSGSPPAPILTFSQFGSTLKSMLTDSLVARWMDSGTMWNITNPLTGSNSTQRWEAKSATSVAAAEQNTTTAYYYRYDSTVAYSVISGSPTAPYLLLYPVWLGHNPHDNDHADTPVD